MPETAQILGEATGHEVIFEPTPIEEVRKLSDDFAMMLEWFDRVGYDADPELAKELGVELTSLPRWAASIDWR